MGYSIVIPVYNEEGNILPLYKSLRTVMDRYCKSARDYEIIFVDDGSRDNSRAIIRRLAAKDKRVRGVYLEQNRGQSAAIFAGIHAARGDVIVTMDADLQNPPSEVPKLLDKIKEGYDAVSGWRYDRQDPFVKKRIPSMISNWLARNLYGIDIHDFGCTLKAYRKDCLSDLPYWPGVHRYLIALVALKNKRICEVAVRHEKRHSGRSKYGGSRILVGLMDLLYIRLVVKPEIRPKRLFGALSGLGFVFGGISLLLGYVYRGNGYYSGNFIMVFLILTLISFFFGMFAYLLSKRYP